MAGTCEPTGVCDALMQEAIICVPTVIFSKYTVCVCACVRRTMCKNSIIIIYLFVNFHHIKLIAFVYFFT